MFSLSFRARWEAALWLLEEMVELGIDGDKEALEYGITAMITEGKVDEALHLLQCLKDARHVVDEVTYASVISVCKSAGHWKQVLWLLDEMEIKSLSVDPKVYNDAIEGIGGMGEWRMAFSM